MPSPLYGQITVSGSAQQLTNVVKEMTAYTIKASSTNSSPVYLGDANVTTGNGFVLNPGDQFDYERLSQNGQPNYSLKPSDFYVVGTASDKVSWLGSP